MNQSRRGEAKGSKKRKAIEINCLDRRWRYYDKSFHLRVSHSFGIYIFPQCDRQNKRDYLRVVIIEQGVNLVGSRSSSSSSWNWS